MTDADAAAHYVGSALAPETDPMAYVLMAVIACAGIFIWWLISE